MPPSCSSLMRCFDRGFDPPRPSLVPFALALREPSVDALTDDAALELGEHAKHLKHRLAGGGRGVETLLMQEEIDALVVEAACKILSRSVSDRPKRSTDQAATTSNSFALTAFSMASRPGRLSRPLAPLIPASS